MGGVKEGTFVAIGCMIGIMRRCDGCLILCLGGGGGGREHGILAGRVAGCHDADPTSTKASMEYSKSSRLYEVHDEGHVQSSISAFHTSLRRGRDVQL
mmetsp:Transcript_38809/g.80611  ORF Transcript_38809/g.80611 Transcript_38809/m.80611 type:complete len:98 (+) Transcript_38809:628-921(+)